MTADYLLKQLISFLCSRYMADGMFNQSSLHLMIGSIVLIAADFLLNQLP